MLNVSFWYAADTEEYTARCGEIGLTVRADNFGALLTNIKTLLLYDTPPTDLDEMLKEDKNG